MKRTVIKRATDYVSVEKAMPSNADLKYSCYLFPQIQYEEMRDEIDE